MLVIKNLDVTMSNLDSRNLAWEFEATKEDIADYLVSVYRSESPGDNSLAGYTLVTSGLSANSFGYIDTSLTNLYDPHRTWFYKIQVDTSPSGGQAPAIGPTPAGYLRDETTDKSYQEILRRKTLALEKYSGRSLKILKRRTFGTHCTLCWDATLMRIRWDDCDECHGTGWTNGYFDALPIKGMMNPSPKYNQITMYGEWRPSDTLLTMLNYPPLKVRDVIIDESNKRWAVRAVRTVEKQGFVIEQNVQCSLIALEDKVYDIDAN